jgi:hypothetical protein
MGDLKRTGSNLYDEELMEGVMSFKKKRYKTNKILSTWQVQNEHTD